MVFWEYDHGSRNLSDLSGDVEAVTGLAIAQLRRGVGWQDLIEVDDRPAMVAIINAAIERRTSLEFEGRFRKADGSRAWARITGAWRTAEVMAGTLVDISARVLLHEELKRMAAEGQAFSQRLALGLEEEKRRIARFLHDDLGQLAVKVLMDIDWIAERRGKEGSTSVGFEIAMADLAELRRDAAEMLAAIRGESRSLLPAVLEEGDLSAALKWLGQLFERKAGFHCAFDFRMEPSASPLPKAHVITLFRISQEAMTNVWKHARATRVEISLSHARQGLLLRIQDNGSGLDVAAAGTWSQVGMRSMKERAEMIGARLSIDSAPGAGLILSVLLPRAAADCAKADPVCI